VPGDTGIWGDIWSGVAAAVVQALVVVGGGLWAFALYKKRREFRPTVRIDSSARIAKLDNGTSRLFLRLHMSNESGAYLRIAAQVVLWDVTTTNEFPQFQEIGRDFPLDYVYGELRPNGVMTGPGGVAWNNSRMESKECIDGELLFNLDPIPDLMAFRASVIQTRYKRLWPFFWIKDLTAGEEWDDFAYLDPAVLDSHTYVAITAH
jgi:hypothetical protein